MTYNPYVRNKVWKTMQGNDRYVYTLYRVAAIFPKHFQCFTVALKNLIFYCFLRAKPSQMFSESWIKKTRYIPAKMNLKEDTRARTVSGLPAGRTVKEITSYGDFSKNTFYDDKWKCCFCRICLCVYDSKASVEGWNREMKIDFTSSSKTALLPTIARAQEEPYGGVGEGGLPLTAALWTILPGASLN